ncbi:MAG: DUF1553 domain-containing protein [Acidobacteria bacterium]|nr:DUF1553 domain-containing protein [Acidobacteriota bacterium]
MLLNVHLVRAAWFVCAPLLLGQAARVEFNRDIRPILSDRCFNCHGPDATVKGIKLRLDSEAGMLADLGGRAAVVPGQAEKSEMLKRITAEKAAVRMPPVHTGIKLSDREIELLRQWIAEGAVFQKHWSLAPPSRPDPPPVKLAIWPKNAIDHFVLARLERDGWKPSPEADKAALIRRVSLDLTGLPPTPAEIDAFLNDSSPNAYEKAVDRLLASPRYGERMAVRWLEAARYADTNGYQTDAERSMWRWRDWVIHAFNRNLPFDQFTIDQIAGDLLPNPTRDQIIATGFNRNHRGNGEGGIIPEEYLVEYVADRVETMSTVFLGTTMGCARCHNHKYDPFTQKDYYQLFAYFNNIAERGRYFKYGNTPPVTPAPTPEQEAKLEEIERQVAAAERRFRALEEPSRLEQAKWEKSLAGAASVNWAVSRGLAAHVPLGRKQFDGQQFHNAGKLAEFGFYSPFTISAWIHPQAPTGAIVTRAKDVLEETGILLMMQDGKMQLNLALRWLDDALRVETEKSVPLNEWHHVMATYDGSRVAEGIHIFLDGKEQPLKIILDELNQDFRVNEPWRIGGGGGPELRYKGLIDEVRIYSRTLSGSEAELLALRQPLNRTASAPANERSKAEQAKLRLAFLEEHAEAEIRGAWKEWRDLVEKRDKLVAGLPTVMVMQEIEKPRDAYLLIRGAYDKPGEKVGRNVPASLHPLTSGVPGNRLALAKWLVDRANPLTARVIANRFWVMYFGIGLVKTVEDFGAQGDWPSHPDLLDWLATEFLGSGWDVKALQKTIVMSATYRQTSRVTPELAQKDPENRLLARGPRVRLSAEMVRDQALAVSGLLVEKIGGPSVKPYQPAGLWKELSGADYHRDKGEDLYRRSLYTFWKRTAPPPAMMNFDASSRETCIVRENRTNTPLQALNLMNDVTYLEAARKMAERMMREGGSEPAGRIAFGFRLATARHPKPNEAGLLADSFRNQLDYYQTDREAALKFLSQGDSPRDEKLDASELAAYAAVASLILNLDETVTKQ